MYNLFTVVCVEEFRALTSSWASFMPGVIRLVTENILELDYLSKLAIPRKIC